MRAEGWCVFVSMGRRSRANGEHEGGLVLLRSRAFFNHGGGAPIPPLLGYENGIVWEKSVCGGHIMEEHLLSGKVIVGGACGTDRLYCSANRVQCALCRNKHESTGKLAVGGVCNADRFHISINRYGASSAGGAAHSMRR